MQEGSQICASLPTRLPPGSWAGALDPSLHAEEDPAVPKAVVLLDALHEKQSQTLLESLATHPQAASPATSQTQCVPADPEPGLNNWGMALLPP